MKTQEKRIYVILPAIVEIGGKEVVAMPPGRQIAQACHVVSKLRHERGLTTMRDTENAVHPIYTDITTIILQARDSKEMMHNFIALRAKRLKPVIFSDENKAVYGDFRPITAVAVFAKSNQVQEILNYLPLWGEKVYGHTSRCC